MSALISNCCCCGLSKEYGSTLAIRIWSLDNSICYNLQSRSFEYACILCLSTEFQLMTLDFIDVVKIKVEQE